MSDQKLKIAVFIDFDNTIAQNHLNQTFDIGGARRSKRGVITKVAYGDWKRSGDHAAPWRSTRSAWSSA